MRASFIVRVIFVLVGCSSWLAGAHADTITLEGLENTADIAEPNSPDPAITSPRQAKLVVALPGSGRVWIGEAEGRPMEADYTAPSSNTVTSSHLVKIANAPTGATIAQTEQDSPSTGSASASLNAAGLIFGSLLVGNPAETHSGLESGRAVAERLPSNVKARKEQDHGEIVNDMVSAPEPASVVLLGLGLSIIAAAGLFRKRKTNPELL
jgi:PEP-CTERM motif-containing protein